MGTRNLTAVVINNEYVVAQYGQWDGYPSAAGCTILSHLKDKSLVENFKNNIKESRWVTQEEIDNGYEKIGVDKSSPCVSLDQASKFNDLFPYLNRDVGYDIIKAIAERKTKDIILRNSINFAKDSLFCEYGYVVDFDKNTFEVYRGFNQTPLDESERFYDACADKHGYYPIKLWACFDLANLPDENDFMSVLTEDEDEE